MMTQSCMVVCKRWKHSIFKVYSRDEPLQALDIEDKRQGVLRTIELVVPFTKIRELEPDSGFEDSGGRAEDIELSVRMGVCRGL